MPTVFISYPDYHNGRTGLSSEIATRLKTLGVQPFSTGELPPGERWSEALSVSVEAADAAIIIVPPEIDEQTRLLIERLTLETKARPDFLILPVFDFGVSETTKQDLLRHHGLEDRVALDMPEMLRGQGLIRFVENLGTRPTGAQPTRGDEVSGAIADLTQLRTALLMGITSRVRLGWMAGVALFLVLLGTYCIVVVVGAPASSPAVLASAVASVLGGFAVSHRIVIAHDANTRSGHLVREVDELLARLKAAPTPTAPPTGGGTEVGEPPSVPLLSVPPIDMAEDTRQISAVTA